MKILEQCVDRSGSIITGKKNLEPLYTFPQFPVFFGATTYPESDDMCADMVWKIDPETGVIQLTKLIPLEILYQEQHVDGCGATWHQYYEAFAAYIVAQRPHSVMEIGGAQGILAHLVTHAVPTCTWTIIEPNPTCVETDQIKTHSAFFDENFVSPLVPDTMVFSQVLEHAYDPRQFIKKMFETVPVGGRVIGAYPDLEYMLRQKFTNAINFEHTMFLTDYFLDYLFKEAGFAIVDKTHYQNHSFFYTCERVAAPRALSGYENKYVEYKKIFAEFISHHEAMIHDINTALHAVDTPVYLFGAHIFSQYLIAFGLHTERIVAILDNSPTKEGKRLYGTPFKIQKPSVLKGQSAVRVILKAGVYTEEIKQDIIQNINPEVVFL